jgi:hypothetical protein
MDTLLVGFGCGYLGWLLTGLVTPARPSWPPGRPLPGSQGSPTVPGAMPAGPPACQARPLAPLKVGEPLTAGRLNTLLGALEGGMRPAAPSRPTPLPRPSPSPPPRAILEALGALGPVTAPNPLGVWLMPDHISVTAGVTGWYSVEMRFRFATGDRPPDHGRLRAALGRWHQLFECEPPPQTWHLPRRP